MITPPSGRFALTRSVYRFTWRCFGLGTLSFVVSSGCVTHSAAPTAKGVAEETLQVMEAPLGGPHFVLHGTPFCFLGANNYYVGYKSRAMTADLFDAARASGLRVLRIWANLDRGSLDESVANVDPPGSKDGVYFQYWDTHDKRPRFNDGETGLEHLDDVLHEARQRDLKLILVLTNNWHEFGGMDQYLAWYGLAQHRAFYEDPRVIAAYKEWAAHLVGRRNTRDGMLYRDDPTILSWELANEPRCPLSPSLFTGQAGCAPDTVLRWSAEMASYLHAIDPHHLVSIGDEGFFAGGRGFGYDGAEGTDHAALSGLAAVDFATFHLYPDTWRTDWTWSQRWIEDHLTLARTIGKPTVLEEYGVTLAKRGDEPRDETRRASAYAQWNDLLVKRGASGGLFWMLAGRDERGLRYPDYDGFTVYRDDSVAKLLASWAPRFGSEAVVCRGSSARVREGADWPYVTVSR